MPPSRSSTASPAAPATAATPAAWRRVAIEGVAPEIDGGRAPAKRVEGQVLEVEADAFGEGHDLLAVRLLHRRPGGAWSEAPMEPLGNDRYRGSFALPELGRFEYMVEAWVDPFRSWLEGVRKKRDANRLERVDLLVGRELVRDAARRATGEERARLDAWARELEPEGEFGDAANLARDPALAALMDRHADRSRAARYGKVLSVFVDPHRAMASAWYEVFPRSCSPEASRPGTLRDLEKRLEYVAGLGFDTVYLPPIHPIGRTNRKGRNNAPRGTPEDVGSPWAIGSGRGGHDAIDPGLGTFDDFDRLLRRARDLGLDVALDLAFQCAPDHPYVRDHPEWFRTRPDGTIAHAENPPKKYEDIVPFDFETEDWPALWTELLRVVRFWIDRGVRTFRVDNPHTKPFAFWEWLIGQVRADRPDVLFLSEAFTRPKVMHRLAKVGFTHSYTYFTWRTTRPELTRYVMELADWRDSFRPHLWPNTPDILPEHLQFGGRPAFLARLVLAATLAPNYGVYGPAFELMERAPAKPGSEEYLDSEKYQVRHWDLEREDSLAPWLATVNRARAAMPALRHDRPAWFHRTDNENLLLYSRRTDDGGNVVLVCVNLDPHHGQAGWTDLDLKELGVDADAPFQVHDLLTDASYIWTGPRNYVELRPSEVPAHVFHVRPRPRTESDFAYYGVRG